MVDPSGVATAAAELIGIRPPTVEKVAPPSFETYRCSPWGVLHSPTSQAAIGFVGLDAAMMAGPTTSKHGGFQDCHVPATSLAPPTTVRSFSSTQPDVPERTSWMAGTGPAPTGIWTLDVRQSSAPITLVAIRTA